MLNFSVITYNKLCSCAKLWPCGKRGMVSGKFLTSCVPAPQAALSVLIQKQPLELNSNPKVVLMQMICMPKRTTCAKKDKKVGLKMDSVLQ